MALIHLFNIKPSRRSVDMIGKGLSVNTSERQENITLEYPVK